MKELVEAAIGGRLLKYTHPEDCLVILDNGKAVDISVPGKGCELRLP